MKPIPLIVAFCIAAFLYTNAAAIEVSGAKLDDRVTIGDQTLILNGAGGLTRAGTKMYVAAFYMRVRKKTLQEVSELTWWAKRITVTMLRDTSSDDLGESIVSGIRKNSTQEETRRFGLQLTKIGEALSKFPKLRKGASLSLDWVPNRGTVVVVDGTAVCDPIPDEAFYEAILKVWLGNEPVDVNLRNDMLGRK